MGRSKRKKPIFNKKQRKEIKAFAVPLTAVLFGLIVGVFANKLLSKQKTPTNLVWAADNTIQIPKDLRKFLESKSACGNYRGADTPTGVGLWGVYQVSQSRFAKIAYGCSWSLDNYVMAIKLAGSWQLLEPKDYFAPFNNGVDPVKGALPFCSAIEKYNIPKDIEPFCINPSGSASSNEKQ